VVTWASPVTTRAVQYHKYWSFTVWFALRPAGYIGADKTVMPLQRATELGTVMLGHGPTDPPTHLKYLPRARQFVPNDQHRRRKIKEKRLSKRAHVRSGHHGQYKMTITLNECPLK